MPMAGLTSAPGLKHTSNGLSSFLSHRVACHHETPSAERSLGLIQMLFTVRFSVGSRGFERNSATSLRLMENTLRGSKVGGKKPLHIVSAWASDQHLTLGQTTIDKKSNEITAIPKLLDALTLSGGIVDIDEWAVKKQLLPKSLSEKATTV